MEKDRGKISKKNALIRLLTDGEYTPSELQQKLDVSLSLVHRYLRDYLHQGYLEKIGTAPTVSYRLKEHPTVASPLIEKHFVFLDSGGRIRYGMEGFIAWAQHHLKKVSFYEKVTAYERCVREAGAARKNRPFFSLNDKMETLIRKAGTERFLKELVAVFPYALPDFGRTKETLFLGIAKDGSSRGRKFADYLINAFIPVVLRYISEYGIDAIAFVPPSASRQMQIMKLLTDRLTAHIPDMSVVAIKKKHQDVIIQQKHLSTARERIQNAMITFVVPEEKKHYRRLLLIDDMVGSGATLNSIAQKVTEQGIAEEIYGIGMVGDEKGFTAVKKV